MFGDRITTAYTRYLDVQPDPYTLLLRRLPQAPAIEDQEGMAVTASGRVILGPVVAARAIAHQLVLI